ncbi:hypothetical protein SUGI_0720880 [Cryptomeria japonica]|nr:hypothetical protein SUGI_0720880 [Cryptomeria japonica]
MQDTKDDTRAPTNEVRTPRKVNGQPSSSHLAILENLVDVLQTWEMSTKGQGTGFPYSKGDQQKGVESAISTALAAINQIFFYPDGEDLIINNRVTIPDLRSCSCSGQPYLIGTPSYPCVGLSFLCTEN